MPTYLYKAMTQNGQIVRNRITDANKMSCVKRLKRNDLIPISVIQTLRMDEKGARKKPRNYRRVNSELKKVGMQRVKEGKKNVKRQSLREKIVSQMAENRKVPSKDIRIFTQNFYLLKKAKFNNVHALSTVMESTENPRLKLVIEDILYGVEAGEFMHTTMEYYSDVNKIKMTS